MANETRDVIRSTEASRVPFEQIASLCAEFTTEWRPTRRPAIPTYLERVDADARPTLLRNLLEHEVKRRRDEGELARAEDYFEDFPGLTGVVREVFVESTCLSRSNDGQNGANTANGELAPLPAVRIGDYRLQRELGRGGMGVVYEAVHVHRGHRVALKMLPQVDGAQLYRFKREFRSAADLSHPNLIGLQSLESDGSQWFFTMDLIDGVDFLTHVRPAGRLDEARLRAALTELVMGVLALHRHHIIHRDLKPSNVMVARDGRVVILDFGLVVELGHGGGAVQSLDRIAGTPGYMAPEQAAARSVSAATDWYAVGTMIYEALAGKRPFDGSVWEILRDKQSQAPVPLAGEAGTPGDLAELSMKMLAVDPHDRPDALAIVKVVASGAGSDTTAVAAASSRRLVGRDHQLKILNDAFREVVHHRQPQAVFIVGRSGEGKTALADAFLAGLGTDRNVAIMAGRCYDRESVPFKAIDSLIDALAGYLRTLGETDAALVMPDDIGVLARVFPVLDRVEVVAKATGGRASMLDDQQVRQRAFGALRSMLGRISRRCPIVWVIDDLQWGDADSAEALFEVMRPPEAPQLLVLGTYRSDEIEGSAFLTNWRELHRRHDVPLAERDVQVGPLTVEGSTDLGDRSARHGR